MAELLLSWVNDEIGLHKHVSNLGTDWTNGYLIGELMDKHNQQVNSGGVSGREGGKVDCGSQFGDHWKCPTR